MVPKIRQNYSYTTPGWYTHSLLMPAPDSIHGRTIKVEKTNLYPGPAVEYIITEILSGKQKN